MSKFNWGDANDEPDDDDEDVFDPSEEGFDPLAPLFEPDADLADQRPPMHQMPRDDYDFIQRECDRLLSTLFGRANVDSIHICVTATTPDGEFTKAIHRGRGSIYSQLGATREWLNDLNN